MPSTQLHLQDKDEMYVYASSNDYIEDEQFYDSITEPTAKVSIHYS